MMKSSIKSTYYASSNPFVSFASSGCAPEINKICKLNSKIIIQSLSKV